MVADIDVTDQNIGNLYSESMHESYIRRGSPALKKSTLSVRLSTDDESRG